MGDDRFNLNATVLQDGHVDPITGPRCFARISEGEHTGRYFVVHTDAVLTEGTPLIIDTITWRASVRDHSSTTPLTKETT
jgi:hypothetical protein